MGREESAPLESFRHGAALRAWIDAGSAASVGRGALQRLRIKWAEYWFDSFASMTARRCANVELRADPVFILGMWRTGSTLLHETLQSATGWTTPVTWQCFRPADFALTSPPRSRQIGRPMDAGRIHTFSPQEDEFAALLLGERSIYRGFIDPHRLHELESILQEWRNHGASQEPPLSDRWETFLRAVVNARPGRLLLKSPNHTFRLPWLAKRFPQAQFVWLLRPESEVLVSNRTMWNAMVERYGHSRLSSDALDSFLHCAIENHDAILEWAHAHIPERLCIASFDEVIGNMPALVSRIRSFCGDLEG